MIPARYGFYGDQILVIVLLFVIENRAMLGKAGFHSFSRVDFAPKLQSNGFKELEEFNFFQIIISRFLIVMELP